MSVFQLRVDVGNKTGDESLAISRFRFIIANKMALMVLACGYGRIHSTKKTFWNGTRFGGYSSQTQIFGGRSG